VDKIIYSHAIMTVCFTEAQNSLGPDNQLSAKSTHVCSIAASSVLISNNAVFKQYFSAEDD